MNTAAPWLFPELQGNNQSTPTSSHTFLLPYLYLSLPLNRYLLPFYLSHLFLLAHVFLVMLLRQSCTSFFSFNVRLLMNFPPVNCSGSLSFTCSKSTRKSRYRSLPFRSFEWNSPGVHKSGYKIKVLAITLFVLSALRLYTSSIFFTFLSSVPRSISTNQLSLHVSILLPCMFHMFSPPLSLKIPTQF